MLLESRPTSLLSGILIHPAIRPQQIWDENWGLYPFGGGEAGSPSNTMCPEPCPVSMPSGILIYPAVWPQQTWAENREGARPPFWGGKAGSPSNTMWPGTRPTCMPSFILIHPTVWSQYTNVIDRQDRQDGTDRKRTDSLWRTVLQTVAQKLQFIHTVDGDGSKTAEIIKRQY